MAAGLGAKTLQEYLVSLGVKLDEKGMTKMEGFLKSSKMGFLALTGIMVTAATVATKWVKQINEAELAYAKEAKAQKKSIETIRASENALKAMGKTKQEIAKDKSLKAVYDDLVKMNKAMALPDGSRGLSLVRSISQEFLKFKSTIQYAMQWVNYHIISKLEGPLTRIRDTMKSWREKLSAEMPLWTAKIADGIAVFVRLLETAVTAGGKIIKFIDNLPDSVKTAGVAIAGVWNIIRAGPIGWLITGLTAVLLLLDDYWTWMKHDPNQPSLFAPLWEGLEDGTFGNKIVTMAQRGINELVKFLNDPETKKVIKAAFTALLDIASDVLMGAFRTFMNWLPKAVQDFLGWDSGLDAGLGNWKDSTEGQKRTVISNGKEVTLGVGDTEPSLYPGVVYRNRNGILEPVLSPEYEKMDYDTEVPQDTKDHLLFLRERWWRGEDPLFKQPEYKSSATGGKTFEQTMADEFLGLLNGKGSGSALSELLSQWEHYPLLKEAYDTESGRLENGETSKKDYDQVIAAIIKGAIGDFRNQTEYFSEDYKYLQWYEAFKNGTLVPTPKPKEDPEVYWNQGDGQKDPHDRKYILDGNVEVRYDPNQVTQATDGATDVAQGAVEPIYVPVIPTFGADGDEEAHFDPNWGKTHNALGGRYDSPTETTLVEDGDTEYVIPIKKLNRAIPLIRMMLSEIGEKGREMLTGFGITPDTDINELVASKGLGMPGGGSPIINIVNNYTNTVNAPATFNINGAGQDPQAVGQAAYNAQERFLVRTLKAVVQSE